MTEIGQTICGANAIQSLLRLAEFVKEMKGDVAEVGVFAGGSAMLLREVLPDDNIYLFDTFEGLPSTNEFDNYVKKGDFGDTSFEGVCALFSEFPNVSVYKGCFPEQNSQVVVDKKFKLVHLDVDTYQSHVDCLKFFHNKMMPKGVIVFDDYTAPTCLGAKIAIDEYAQEHGLYIHFGGDHQAYIVY
jgi:O-methyltransferase